MINKDKKTKEPKESWFKYYFGMPKGVVPIIVVIFLSLIVGDVGLFIMLNARVINQYTPIWVIVLCAFIVGCGFIRHAKGIVEGVIKTDASKDAGYGAMLGEDK